MADTGIPNIRVIIREADENNLLVDVPTLSVRVVQDDSYNVNVTPPVTVTFRSGSYNRYADLALTALTASYFSGSVEGSASYAVSSSYAETVNQNFTGNVNVTGDISASGITGSFIGNEYRLIAGDVSLTFTGSINSGVFGVSEDVLPYISTVDYAGTTIEYVAQRTGATRIGIILATWTADSVVFTDVSTADIGDTKDISFSFIKVGDFYKLRVNSNGSGSGAWTVQSLFKLFPNLNP